MLQRRVTDHVRKQEWTAIAIDFVIVIVGVFVGIKAANWNRLAQMSLVVVATSSESTTISKRTLPITMTGSGSGKSSHVMGARASTTRTLGTWVRPRNGTCFWLTFRRAKLLNFGLEAQPMMS